MTRLVPAVLKDEPQYRLLFAGQLLSIFGDRVSMLVLPFAVLAVGGTVTDVVAVSVAQFLPFVVLALPAGVWADRFDRKRIVIASDAVRMVTQATAAATLITGTATVPLLAALAAMYGAADAFFSPAITALVPAIVSPRNLQPANALRGLTFSLGSVLGPAIGGVLVALLGPGGGFAFDAATFVVSVACLLRLRPAVLDAALTTATPVTERFLPSLARGWREVVSRRWVLAFLAGWTGYSVLVLPSIFALGPALAARDYGGAPGWAIITAGYGIGSVLGDLILLAWRPRFALRVGALALVGASCQAAIIGSGMGVWPIAGLELVAGICVTGCFTLWETSLQEHIPAGQLARVSSYDYLTSTGFIPLGTLLGGALTAALGLQPAMVLMSAVGVCTALGVLAVPAVRALPRGRTDPDPA